jgi:hypothetical protein
MHVKGYRSIPVDDFDPGMRRKSGASGALCAFSPGTCSPGKPAPARSRACALRRLRFSRNAADNRLLRASFFSCLPCPIMTVCLRQNPPYGKDRRAFWRFSHAASRHACCRSSVVEHPLGKGEVVSSILTGSTTVCPCSAAAAVVRAGRPHQSRKPNHIFRPLADRAVALLRTADATMNPAALAVRSSRNRSLVRPTTGRLPSAQAT